MNTTRYLPTIAEDLDTLKDRHRRQRQAILKQRLHLLILIKTQAVESREQAAQHLALHRNTISRWLRLYQQGGLDTLLTRRPPGAPSGQKSLSPSILAKLQERLNTPQGFASYRQAHLWLQETFDLTLPYKTLYKIMRVELKAKLKRPRPSHAKKTMK
jgi:transposase